MKEVKDRIGLGGQHSTMPASGAEATEPSSGPCGRPAPRQVQLPRKPARQRPKRSGRSLHKALKA